MEYCQDFGKRMRDARQKAQKSQRQIADATGISPQMISAYENNTRFPSIEVAAKLAGELGASLDYLCGIEVPHDSKQTIKNYADLIAYIAELPKYLRCQSYTRMRPRNEDDYEIVDECNKSGNFGQEVWITEDRVAVIEIEDGLIAEFFKRWGEIQALHQKGIISDELLDSWYLGEMERMQKWINVGPRPTKWFGMESITQGEPANGHH